MAELGLILVSLIGAGIIVTCLSFSFLSSTSRRRIEDSSTFIALERALASNGLGRIAHDDKLPGRSYYSPTLGVYARLFRVVDRTELELISQTRRGHVIYTGPPSSEVSNEDSAAASVTDAALETRLDRHLALMDELESMAQRQGLPTLEHTHEAGTIRELLYLLESYRRSRFEARLPTGPRAFPIPLQRLRRRSPSQDLPRPASPDWAP